MKKIYFKGYYGFKNLGDDMFCVTADWLASNLWENKTPVFIGKDLPNLSKKALVINIKNDFLKRFYELYICFKVSNIIYFGGSVLSKVSGYKDLKFYLSNISFLNSKVGTIGTSIGPFKTKNNQSSIKKLLSGFKFIEVRDYSSVATVEEMNISVPVSFSFDPAILVKDVYPSLNEKKESNTGYKLAVSLCHYERYKNLDKEKEEKREKAILEFLKKAIDRKPNVEEIVFFEFNGDKDIGDYNLIQEFIFALKNEIKTSTVRYSKNTESFCEELNKCDFLIGTRLHSGILAYALNIPFLLVEYHPKCTEFLNTINHNYRFDISDISESLKNFDLLSNKKYVPNIIDSEEFRRNFKIQVQKVEKLL